MSVETVKSDEVEGEEILGSAVQRREDTRLITGDAEYVDDIQYPRMAHLSIVRSQYGHARIGGVDTSEAEAMDGVVAVYTGEDIEDSGVPGNLDFTELPFVEAPEHPMMATDKVVYQGEPVAAVVAEDRYTASEAADAIDVDYDRLDAVVDPVEAADDDAPVIHDDVGDNVALEWDVGDEEGAEDALDGADTVVELEMTNQRLIPTAMEPRATVARFTPSTEELTVEMTSQNPHNHRDQLAGALGLSQGQVRVRSPDVGGGFGSKIHHYSDETITAWCSMQLERPVKWQATRSEGFLTSAHGRDHVTTAKLGVDDDGTITGLHVDSYVGIGGYMSTVQASVATSLYALMLPGQYDLPAIYAAVTGTYTNTTPVDAYRGAGRPEAAYTIERIMAAAAKEIGMDPAEFRRKNFLPADGFPHEVPTGHVYDSGDYEKTLEKAMGMVDYEALRERQEELRDEGRYLGVGVSCYIEACGLGPGLLEGGHVRMNPSGDVVVSAGTHSHGQGHRTSYAQIVASELGVDYDDIQVREGDTDDTPEGNGTSGSRSGPVGGAAVLESARKIKEKARSVAAHQLEADEGDVEFAEGEFFVSGAPDRSVTFEEVAGAAYAGDVPEGVDPGLEETTYFNPDNFTFPFGTHIVVVEVDPETGEVEFEQFAAVDDVGKQINPKIVEGQIHGGIAQGFGQAVLEGAEYDENGQLLTGSMQDYAIPKAGNTPELDVESTVTECPHNPLGVKGVGEAGTIGSTPAVVNAVVDALEPFGIDDVDMPVEGENVWRAIQKAEGS